MFSAFALALASSQCAPHPQIWLVAATSRAHVARRDGSFSATARVTLAVHVAARGAVSSDPGMRAHVAGYFTIARRLAQSSDVSGIGTTEAQARSRLARAAATIAYDANLEYKRQVQIYDAVTANGRAQDRGPASGFPGGPNSEAFCSR